MKILTSALCKTRQYPNMPKSQGVVFMHWNSTQNLFMLHTLQTKKSIVEIRVGQTPDLDRMCMPFSSLFASSRMMRSPQFCLTPHTPGLHWLSLHQCISFTLIGKQVSLPDRRKARWAITSQSLNHFLLTGSPCTLLITPLGFLC